MSASTISVFMEYFNAFEDALSGSCWDRVEKSFCEDIVYSVEGVPFACEVKGRAEVIAALQKSTAAFDATMDFRLLEILTITRIAHNHIRAELLSGYGRDATGAMTAPVTIEVKSDGARISSLRDIYDPTLTLPALSWLAAYIEGADPSYV